jgi:hypothetical protein
LGVSVQGIPPCVARLHVPPAGLEYNSL